MDKYKLIYKFKTGDGWLIFDNLDGPYGLFEGIKEDIDANTKDGRLFAGPFPIEIEVDEMTEKEIAELPEY